MRMADACLIGRPHLILGECEPLGRDRDVSAVTFGCGCDVNSRQWAPLIHSGHMRHAGMAYTFQITSVYGKLSFVDNIALALRNRDRAQALDRVGLADRADQMTGDMSYGHQRLLEIARGVAQNPRLLIPDEPTQGLAESEIAGFNALIKELAGETKILLIEHNMNVVMALADQITLLETGQILATGTPTEIHANKMVQDAYLGSGGC